MGRKELLLDFIKHINHNDVITIFPHPRILNKKELVNEFLNKYEDKHWIHRNDDYNDWLECPSCGYGSEGEVKFGEGTPYCPYCGERLEEDKKQINEEYINRETAIDNITTGLCNDITCAECPFNDANDMCKVREWLKQLPWHKKE